MARLIYSGMTSLDGYIADEDGSFDWAEPDAEVHAFANECERPVGTYLYGRKMYEVMVYWETANTLADAPAVGRDYAEIGRDYAEIWQAADKVVYSRTLDTVSSARTRVERDFDPESVRTMKASAERDITVSGPELASHAIKAGLVDEIQLLVTPVTVGGGKKFLPAKVRLDLDLTDERPFRSGVVYLQYRVRH